MKKILLLTTCVIFIGAGQSFAQTTEKKTEKATAIPVSTKLESPAKLKSVTPEKPQTVSEEAKKETESTKVEVNGKKEEE